MNNLEQNKSGFTLIEIIVVLIIVGVLVSISLPNLFRQIERNRAQKALNTMNYIRAAIESCGVNNNNSFDTSCDQFSQLNIDNPNNTEFSFAITGTNATSTDVGGYTITATRQGAVGGNTVKLTRSTTGLLTCEGEGNYAGFC